MYTSTPKWALQTIAKLAYGLGVRCTPDDPYGYATLTKFMTGLRGLNSQPPADVIVDIGFELHTLQALMEGNDDDR